LLPATAKREGKEEMNMRHTIELTKLIGRESANTFSSCCGEGSLKQIMTVVMLGEPSTHFFRVVSHEKVVLETPDLQLAIDAYNSEP
jgi:hypothetical protein